MMIDTSLPQGTSNTLAIWLEALLSNHLRTVTGIHGQIEQIAHLSALTLRQYEHSEERCKRRGGPYRHAIKK